MNEDLPKKVDFYGREFIVTPDVLIPRPETEMMVDAVLNLAGKSYLPGVKPAPAKLPQKFHLLDVGTGSGCVAISIALELPDAEVAASDISEKALAVARKNTTNLSAEVEFIQSDLLTNISNSPNVIVANLPYVDKEWDWLDKKSLAKEPALALYADDGGLALIKKLIRQIKPQTTSFLILEADPCQHEQVISYAEQYYFRLLEKRGFVLIFETRGDI